MSRKHLRRAIWSVNGYDLIQSIISIIFIFCYLDKNQFRLYMTYR